MVLVVIAGVPTVHLEVEGLGRLHAKAVSPRSDAHPVGMLSTEVLHEITPSWRAEIPRNEVAVKTDLQRDVGEVHLRLAGQPLRRALLELADDVVPYDAYSSGICGGSLHVS